MPRIDGGWMVRAVTIGLIAGFLAGLFGVGGGIVAVPGLVLLLGLTQHRAHATSMAAILATATAAALTAGFAGSVDWAVAAVLASGSAVGAYIGTRMLDRISEVWLAVAFSVLATVSAVRLFIGSGEETSPAATVAWSPRLAVSLVLVGLVAGTLAALLGVGGGIIYVPAMVLLLGISQHVAQGSSLAAIIPTAVVATWANLRAGRVDKRAAVVVGLGGVAAGVAGVQLALRIEGFVLQRMFAVLLVLVTIQMLLKVVRSARQPAAADEG
jgi:uncharacterized membrane protein YfcA